LVKELQVILQECCTMWDSVLNLNSTMCCHEPQFHKPRHCVWLPAHNSPMSISSLLLAARDMCLIVLILCACGAA
jgi:hypothetical protein